MLILSRRQGESIILDLPDGEQVKITVVKIGMEYGSGRIRLGFEAPRDVEIVREEIHHDHGSSKR